MQPPGIDQDPGSGLARYQWKILGRTHIVAGAAFLSAWLTNPGTGIIRYYNGIIFPLMLCLGLLGLVLIWRELASRVFLVRYTVAIYVAYVFLSLIGCLFVFPGDQDIYAQFMPLLPYFATILLFIFVFLPPRSAIRSSLAYTAALVAMMVVYRLVGRTPPIPAPIQSAFFQQFVVVHAVLVALLGASMRLKTIYFRSRAAEKALESLAYTDELTGLTNRRLMNDVVQREFARFHGTQAEFSLAIIDIDHFKQVNDRHGHDVGDQVLKLVAQILKRSVRTSDWVGRWGGEEFLLLLPCTPTAAPNTLLERIRETIAAHADPALPRVTVSIGEAVVRPSDANLEALLKRADEALYRAKGEGRNRVIKG